MIHDLVPLHFPDWVHRRTARMHGAKYRHAARACDVVIANSTFTADDVAETLDVPRERIQVAHPGVEPAFSPEGEHADLGRPYALTVATLEPRKNLGTLVEAWRALGEDELALAVSGAAGWGEQPRLEVPGVLRLGYTPDEELPALFRGATVFVFPSRFEGFGIPVLEAMVSGVPCVVSAHPSLDEACGDAAVRVDPEDADAIAAGIREALDRRDDLVPRGLEHARGRLATWTTCCGGSPSTRRCGRSRSAAPGAPRCSSASSSGIRTRSGGWRRTSDSTCSTARPTTDLFRPGGAALGCRSW
jgi:alpha-1,3-rhamnosyl/mannosyltransferase